MIKAIGGRKVSFFNEQRKTRWGGAAIKLRCSMCTEMLWCTKSVRGSQVWEASVLDQSVPGGSSWGRKGEGRSGSRKTGGRGLSFRRVVMGGKDNPIWRTGERECSAR